MLSVASLSQHSRSAPWGLLASLAFACVGCGPPSPDAVFQRVAPSVVVVRVMDARGQPVGQGSGVVIDAGRVITCNHVIEAAGPKGKLFVAQLGREWPAQKARADRNRDLAEVKVAGLKAPAVPTRASLPEVGERVYAVGAPHGLELTFSEGVVSGLRTMPSEEQPLIQVTAPISGGSSGGGLFDSRGRLVGITSVQIIDGQNLNFGLPECWIDDLRASRLAKVPLPFIEPPPTSKPRREKKSQADRDEEFKASLPQRWAADRAAVLTELRNQDEADTLRLLCGLVRSGGSAGRTAAVEAIAALQIDARTSLGCLSRRLEQERDASARMALLMAMRRFGSESDSYLTSYDLQHHSDPWMRALAAEALGNTALAAGPGRGVGDSHSLAEMLRDRDATVRNAAYRSLVRAGPVAASTLAQKIYCRPDDPEQAILAARALGEIGPAARQGTAGSSIVASLRRASKCEADRALADAAQRALSSVSR